MKGVFKYSHLLEGLEHLNRVSMGEGDTPLLPSKHIGPSLGFKNLYFKLESLNPTGSYKDRFASLAISGLLSKNQNFCLATSSGNTGASLAAYAALADIPCHVAIVDGAPMGKLAQMQAYGAHLWMIKDFGISDAVTDKTIAELKHMAKSNGTTLLVSAFTHCPFGMQGVQTISYEIAEALDKVDQVFVPAGGGGLTLAVARGFEKLSETGLFKTPKVNCVQPAGNDTMASAIRNKLDQAQEIDQSTTAISGLQVPTIIDGNLVVAICRKCHGNGYVVEDQSVFEWQKKLALTEGIYCEPAAAVSVAGFVQALKAEEVDAEENVVCIITGHGFKDPGSTELMTSDNPIEHISKTDEISF